ncbi:MAG: phosphodiester glycosidase family protein [Solobacterium sp.]|nr:phosphodiester glycosidase family protein [Solobacterium sp.]
MAKNQKQGMSAGLLAAVCIFIVVLSALLGRYFYLREMYHGEAVAYSRNAVKSLKEGSFDYKLARTFYTDDEWDALFDEDFAISERTDEEAEPIEVIHISGSTYEGYMMLVHHPEDVYVAVNPNMNNGQQAPSLEDYVKMNKAVAGINAGGFEDAGGTGNGGLAWGIVIHEGKLISGNMNTFLPIIAIDKDLKLMCVDATAADALKWGAQEAVTFGPTFINNYEVVYKDGDGDYPMLNPRTAIGQAGDGTFLLLVLDGRGPSFFGALYEDVIKILRSYDAQTAANLDGGNSTAMIYKGKYVNTTVSMYGSRHLPTVFLVKGDE